MKIILFTLKLTLYFFILLMSDYLIRNYCHHLRLRVPHRSPHPRLLRLHLLRILLLWILHLLSIDRLSILSVNYLLWNHALIQDQVVHHRQVLHCWQNLTCPFILFSFSTFTKSFEFFEAFSFQFYYTFQASFLGSRCSYIYPHTPDRDSLTLALIFHILPWKLA